MLGMSKADFYSGDSAHTERLFKQAKMVKGMCSHRWNPFSYISRNPLFMYKDISNMAAIMLPMAAKNSGDGFWTESARKLFVGLSLYMLETEHERKNRNTDYRQSSSLSYLYRLTTPANGKSLTEWLKDELDRRNKSDNPLSDANAVGWVCTRQYQNQCRYPCHYDCTPGHLS